jgi:ribosomal protein S12 methylthiotransferase accessory factor
VAHGRADLLGACGHRRFDDVPSRNFATLAEDLEALRAGLAVAGLRRWIVVDLDKPEFGLPVVRVVVPGLEDGVAMPGYVPGERARDAWTIVP